MIQPVKVLLLLSVAGSLSLSHASAAALAAEREQDEKNVYEVRFRDCPDRFERLLQTEPEAWDFRFRPYDASEAAFLVSDPAIQRDVQSGKIIEGKRPTALHLTCNAEGFALLVFSGEPALREAMTKGEAAPANSLEIFFAPGDADLSKIEHYYQFIIDLSRGELRDFPWLVEDRGFRRMKDYATHETRRVANGHVTRVFIPWELLFDRLPFTDKRDNFWRLSVIRWATGGGQTWGGVVHEANRAGYIRWPVFAPAQKHGIYEHVLQQAWNRYRTQLARANPASVPDLKEPFTRPGDSRSYVNLQEDRAFVEGWLAPLVAERNALGKSIAAFQELPDTEKERLYSQAGKMMNFNCDVDKAYAQYLKRRLFAR